jgi:hypothetical protein
MEWLIYIDTTSPTGLRIKFNPGNEVLSGCFESFKISNLPRLTLDISESRSTGDEFIHIRNYRDLDWEDKIWVKDVTGTELSEGELFLAHDIIGEVVIKEHLFDEALLNYLTELLKVYNVGSTLPNDWFNQMQSALKGLENKIGKK